MMKKIELNSCKTIELNSYRTISTSITKKEWSQLKELVSDNNMSICEFLQNCVKRVIESQNTEISFYEEMNLEKPIDKEILLEEFKIATSRIATLQNMLIKCFPKHFVFDTEEICSIKQSKNKIFTKRRKKK